MADMSAYYFIFLTVLFVSGDAVPQYVYQTELITSLLKDYVTEVKPSSNPVSILVRPLALAISDIDESVDVLTVSLMLEQVWTDPRLSWQPSLYGNISRTRMSLDNIWKPDLQLMNKFKEDPVPMYEGYAYLAANGTTAVYPVWTLSGYCPLDLTNFPFDTQTCVLTFGSSAHDLNSMTLQLINSQNENVDVLRLGDATNKLEPYIYKHPLWNVMDVTMSLRNQTFSASPVPFSLADLTLTLKRNAGFMSLIMVVPSFMLAFLVPVQFILPTSSPQRSPFSLLLVACYATLMTVLQLNSPFVHSSISRIGMFQVVNIIFAVVAAMMSSFITGISAKGKQRRSLPYWLNQVLMTKVVRLVLCLGESPHISNLYTSINSQIYAHEADNIDSGQSDGQETSRGEGQTASGSDAYIRATARSISTMAKEVIDAKAVEKVQMEWDDVSRALDRVCLILFSFMFVVSVMARIVI